MVFGTKSHHRKVINITRSRLHITFDPIDHPLHQVFKFSVWCYLRHTFCTCKIGSQTLSGAMDYFMITTEELKSFHAIDREIFSRLVINLRRDVAVSMRVIAFWIWLEELGYPNIILKMLPLPDSMVNVLAEEAASCLNYVSVNVTRPSSRNSNDTPLTSGLMNRNISFQLVHERRITDP
uniref:Uncharacterized protein n=1 Tax=Nelumbo nucifera TaxID=4432 RepID=A0A822Z0F0_NELNU|nr:TPA_asm: hypothetical protein HUJ06_007610 [Nelumbo nucifera]